MAKKKKRGRPIELLNGQRVCETRRIVRRVRRKNPLFKLKDIAKIAKVSIPRVWAILRSDHLSTRASPYNRKFNLCPACKILITYEQRFCSDECYIQYYYIILTCYYCGRDFRKKKILIKQRMPSWNAYCSFDCFLAKRKEKKRLTFSS